MRYELNFSHLQAVIRAIIEKLKNVERAANAVPDINGLVNANEDLRRQVALYPTKRLLASALPQYTIISPFFTFHTTQTAPPH